MTRSIYRYKYSWYGTLLRESRATLGIVAQTLLVAIQCDDGDPVIMARKHVEKLTWLKHEVEKSCLWPGTVDLSYIYLLERPLHSSRALLKAWTI